MALNLGQLIAAKMEKGTPNETTQPQQATATGQEDQARQHVQLRTQRAEATAPDVAKSIAANNLFASAMAAANKAANVAPPVASSLVGEAASHADIKDKLAQLLQWQIEDHPLMPQLLNQIHGILIQRHDLVAALTEEEIGYIVSGAAKAKGIVLAKAAAEKKTRTKKNISVEDI